MNDTFGTTIKSKSLPKPDRPLAVQIEGRRATVPGLIARNGENAARRFLEFFAATIRNKNTRAAYYQAVTRFFAWCEQDAYFGATSVTQ